MKKTLIRTISFWSFNLRGSGFHLPCSNAFSLCMYNACMVNHLTMIIIIPMDLTKLHTCERIQTTYVDQVWWWAVKNCDLYRDKFDYDYTMKQKREIELCIYHFHTVTAFCTGVIFQKHICAVYEAVIIKSDKLNGVAALHMPNNDGLTTSFLHPDGS